MLNSPSMQESTGIGIFFRYCTLSITFFLLFFSQKAICNKRIDSLVNILKQEMHIDQKLAIYRQVYEYYINNDIDSAHKYLERGLNLARKSGRETYIISFSRSKTLILRDIADFDRAEDILLTCLEMGNVKKEKSLTAKILNDLGLIYLYKAQYINSIEYFIAAFNEIENLDENHLLSQIYHNIADVCIFFEEYDLAKYYLGKSNEQLKSNRELKMVAATLNTLGIILYFQGERKKARTCFYTALNVAQKSEDLRNISIEYFNLAEYYYRTGNNDSALIYINKCLKIDEKLKLVVDMVKSYELMGKICLKMNKNNGLNYLEKAHNLAYENKLEFDLMNILLAYKDYYDEINSPRESFRYYEMYLKLKRKIEASNNVAFFQRILYDFYTNERQNLVNKNFKEINERKSQISKKRSKTRKVITLQIILILIIWSLIRLNHIAHLKDRNANKELENTFLFKQMKSHFIFNSLSSIQNYIFILSPQMLENYLESLRLFLSKNIDDFNSKILFLSREIEFNKSYLELQRIRFFFAIDYKIEVDEIINLKYCVIPSMLIQPLIENSIKHGRYNEFDKISIRIKYSLINDRYLKICVTDNGMGINKSLHNKEINGNGLSLAIKNIQARLKYLEQKNNTKISFYIEDLSEKDVRLKGTKNTVILPYVCSLEMFN